MKPHCYCLLIVFLLFLSSLSLQAQTESDSLRNLLENDPPDTVKIDTYIALHKAVLAEDTTQAMEYLRQAITLSEKIDEKRRLSWAYLQMVNYVRTRGRLQEAKKILAEVEKQLPFVHYPKIEATYFMEYGIVKHTEGMYDQAMDFYLNALSGYETLGDTAGIAKCYSNIGNCYWELEKMDNALDYFFKALQLIESGTEYDAIAGFLGNIGLIYRAKQEYEKALEYYQQSLEISRKHGFKFDAAITLQNMGVLYQKQGDLDLALKYIEESYALSREIDDQIGVLYSSHGVGAILGSMGNYQEAIVRLEQALQMAEELNIKEEIKNIYMSLAEAYEKMGKYRLSLENRKLYETWKDSIASENHLNQIKELEVKYETEKKNQQIALLTVEKELQASEARQQAAWKKALTGGIILITIIGGMIILMLRQRLKNQKTLAAKNEEIKASHFKRQLSELEMKALRAQMDPHFIFNCMNSINRMILSGEGDSASRYLTKFAKLIRLMLENSENPTVSLEDELSMLEAYIQLEALRFKGKISYRMSVDEAIDQENTYLPSMVLQPFIENAIWHGLMHKEGEGMIHIMIHEEENILKCTIEDNGVGREKALALKEKTVLKGKSMGLKITEERLKLLSKEGLQQLIRITDLKDTLDRAIGTRVDVAIPIHS